MVPQVQKLFSESQRQSFAEGEAIGEAKGEARGEAKREAKGEAKAVLKILARRAIAVDDLQRRRIAECTDLATLDHWMDTAFSVTSVDELLG